MSQFTLKQDNVFDADVFTFTDDDSPGASGDATSDIVHFSTAQTREPLTSGSTLAQLFSSVKKWFTDLKAVCFSGSYTDLVDTPDLDLKADKSYADWIAGLAENSVSQIQFNNTVQAIANDIGTKANQTDLDETNDNIEAVIDEIATVDGKTVTNASAINTLKGTSGLYEKANRSTVDAVAAAVGAKANQSALNTTNTNLSTLATAVGTKANQSALNTTNTNLSTLAGDGTYPGSGLTVKANLSYVNDLSTRIVSRYGFDDDYGTHRVSPERIIGQFDIKPLYGRTIYIYALRGSAGVYNYIHGIANIGIIMIGRDSFSTDGTNYIPIPFVYSTLDANIGLYATTTDVKIHVGMARNTYSATIFLEYTKTTD